MIRNRTLRLVLMIAGLVLVLPLAAGCDRDKVADLFRKSPTQPAAPVPVDISLGGECHVLGATIQCEDSSSPEGEISEVRWTLRNSATGLTVASKSAEAGGIVEFAGLAPGTYSVEQTVTPTVGADATEVYGGLMVPGG